MTLKEILQSAHIPGDLALDLIPQGDLDPDAPLDIRLTVNGREVDVAQALRWWAEEAEASIGRALVMRLPRAIEEAESDLEDFARRAMEEIASACAGIAKRTPGAKEAEAEIWRLYGHYVPEYSR